MANITEHDTSRGSTLLIIFLFGSAGATSAPGTVVRRQCGGHGLSFNDIDLQKKREGREEQNGGANVVVTWDYVDPK